MRQPSALGGVAVFLACACSTPRVSRDDGSRQYSYVVTPPAAGSWDVAIEATFEGTPSGYLVASDEPSAYRNVAVVDRGAVPPAPRQGSGWSVPACQTRCSVRYTVD